MAVTNPQNQRRAKYGVNVVVALVAACALVLLVNWLAVWAFARLPESIRPWLRYDLTATRAYTLSDQTRRVLASMPSRDAGVDEPLELIGVYADGTPQARVVDELLDQYAAASDTVSVRRFDPQADADGLRSFYAELAEGLGQVGRTQATLSAIEDGTAALQDLTQRLDQVVVVLGEAVAALDSASPAEQNIAEQVDGVAGGVVAFIDAGETFAAQLTTEAEEPLPDVARMRTDVLQRLQAAAAWTDRLRTWLRGRAQGRDMPAAVRDAAIRAERRLEGMRASLGSAQSRVTSVGVDAAYRRLHEASSRQASVLVRRGTRLRAVNLDDMFEADEAAMDALNPGDGSDLTAAQTLPVRFLGEERLTGAVVSVSLDQPPLLLFVSLDGRPAMGPEGTHNQVAARARSAGFEIAPYSVVAQASGASLRPAPQLNPDRRVVWFVPAANPDLPTDAAARTHLASILKSRLALGDGVFMTPGLRVGASVIAEDPLLMLAEETGIGVDPGAVVLAPGVDDRGAEAAMNTFRVQAFAEHAITAPLDGRSVWLDFAHPVTLSKTASPLIGLQADGLWIESDPPTDVPLATATAEAFELAPDGVTVAAVAVVGDELSERPGRLAVVADPLWSTDPVIRGRQAGGNVELFTNVVYWLARLDEAIAATPRSQGVRRIGPMNEAARRRAAWLAVAGWPLLAMVAGTAVWAVRRRG
ncbi:MAG: hypothetical protein AAF328_12085 [Planctomycetota bacterium]